jgi:hypothetical protein
VGAYLGGRHIGAGLNLVGGYVGKGGGYLVGR